MMVFKRRQVIILSLVLLIVVFGYLQYSYRKSSVSVSDKNSGKLGEAVYVENTSASQDQNAANDQKTTAKDAKSTKAVAASKLANDYFAQAKLDKEAARSKDENALKDITQDKNASKDARDKAYAQMVTLIGQDEKEMKLETMVKEKGFADVVVLFGDDGSLDIVVKAPSLTAAQVVQITDIASRQANVDIGKIHVRNLY